MRAQNLSGVGQLRIHCIYKWCTTLQASSYNFIIAQALESLYNPGRGWVLAKRRLWMLIGSSAYAVNQTEVWAPKCNPFSNRDCMSLHYCWPTRALNSFCVTEFINLPSLHRWQMLPERRPWSQGKLLAGSCLPASQELEQWACSGGLAVLGKSQNVRGLAEAEVSWWAQEPTVWSQRSSGPWEPESSRWVEHASKQSRSRGLPGKLEGTRLHHEPTYTMQISPYSWDAGFTLPILEVGRLRLTEVMPFVHRAN